SRRFLSNHRSTTHANEIEDAKRLRQSRAIAVQARTLECFEMMGIAVDAFIAASIAVSLVVPEEADGIVERIKAAGNVCVQAYEALSREKLLALREATAGRGMMMPGHVP